MSAPKYDPIWTYLGQEGSRARSAVRFATGLPEQVQLSLLAELQEVGTKRTRRERITALDRNGRAVLEARGEEPAKRPWIVRYYFTSMAGELLATEFGGFTEAEARAHTAARDAVCWSVKRPRELRCTGLDDGDALAAHYPKFVGTCATETWCRCGGSGLVEKPAPALRSGVRVVTFPSEM